MAGESGMAKDEAPKAEQDADAWSRFERAVDAAVKPGSKPKEAQEAASKKDSPDSKGRARKGKAKAIKKKGVLSQQ